MILNTREYVAALESIVREGKEASMVIWGGSMTPFLIHARDRIWFSAPDRPLRRGDMVFYKRDSGQYVMHRICRVRPEGYYITGDAHKDLEGPVRRDQIFARITRVERKGKVLTDRSLLWKLFAGPWVTLRPIRRWILRIYAVFRRGTAGTERQNGK